MWWLHSTGKKKYKTIKVVTIKCSHCLPWQPHSIWSAFLCSGKRATSFTAPPSEALKYWYTRRELAAVPVFQYIFVLFMLPFFSLKKTCLFGILWPWESDGEVHSVASRVKKCRDRNHCVTWFFGDVPFHAKFLRLWFLVGHRFHGLRAGVLHFKKATIFFIENMRLEPFRSSHSSTYAYKNLNK